MRSNVHKRLEDLEARVRRAPERSTGLARQRMREHLDRLASALLARLGYGEIARDYPGVGSYALKAHERECLLQPLRGGGVHS